MKLYTLTYDANQPTVQQVNVPTNTDYKVGIKVRRNGEIQSLSPDSAKLYTGETITVEPTDFNADKSLADSTTTLVIPLMPATISADLGGKTINTVVPEVSYDNGTTWGEVYVTGEVDQYFYVMDKSQGNYYYARLNLKNSTSKWEYLDGTQTGVVSTSGTITMPTNPQAFLNSSSSTWSITQFPCIFRLVIKYGGYSYPVYIEPDTDKTNGYVTFTLSSDDNASYTQETLIVDTNVNPLGTSQIAEIDNSAGSAAEKLSCDIPVDESMVGWTLVPAPDYFKVMRGLRLTKPVKISDLSSTLYDGWNFSQAPAQFAEEANGRKWYLTSHETTGHYLGYADPGETDVTPADSMELTPGAKWHVVTTGNVNAGTVGALGFIVNLQKEGFTASFTINTNVFKSQQGDIADGVESASTAKLSGKFADGTDFDYNLVVV